MTISTTTLKNAALAIECDLWTDPATGANYLAKDGAILRRWEPGHDDGDSFRLMAALGLDIQLLRGMMLITAEDYYGDFRGECEWTTDRAAAYRTAILLCAAKIGAAL